MHKPLVNVNLQPLLRSTFTLVCLLFFVQPVYLLLTLSAVIPPAVQMSSWVAPAVASFVFIFILAVHLYHVQRGKLYWFTVFLGLLLPAVVILVATDYAQSRTGRLVNGLRSHDCHLGDAKWELQQAWDEAYTTMSKCFSDTLELHNGSVTEAQLRDHFRLSDCTEAARETVAGNSYLKSWAYLQQMEVRHLCAGWCYQGPQIWADTRHKDTCAVAVAVELQEWLQRAGMVTLPMIVAIVVAVALLFSPDEMWP